MNIRILTATLLLITASTTVQSASLTLVPSAGTVVQNGTFTVDLVLNASDLPLIAHPNLYGGSVIVDFNKTLLSYGGFTLKSGLSFFDAPVTTTNGNTQTVTFGFDNAPDVGTVGTFSFSAIGAPGSLAALGLVDADDYSGSFASYNPGYKRFTPAFTGTQVNISAVPLPAGVWLLGTAVGALAACRRFRHAVA
jgi:hypothetical protein